MSPEQAEGRELGASSDVFSLGAVLVMACTGASPFAAASVPQELYRVVHTEPDLSALPSCVRLVAAACLAKDPGARPDLARLREMIGELAPSARPWPATVYALAVDQRAEIDRLLVRARQAGDGPVAPAAIQVADAPTAVVTRARDETNQLSHRYVIAAVAVRTDLSSDGSIGPWLSSAAAKAANSAGPQNRGGQ